MSQRLLIFSCLLEALLLLIYGELPRRAAEADTALRVSLTSLAASRRALVCRRGQLREEALQGVAGRLRACFS